MTAPRVAELTDVSHRYKHVAALANVTLALPAGVTVGLIGPDGVGKSTLLSLITGARALQRGEVHVLGGDMRSVRHRRLVGRRIAFMPQGLGRNLYPTLSVRENADFFARLFGYGLAERRDRIDVLLSELGLLPFADRRAAQLSGGMKQKLALCCALIHDPDMLVLDEPTTGVDPLSRRRFWDLIERIRTRITDLSVIVATAYMEEAERFDWLVAMDGGRVLSAGTPASLKGASATLEQAFVGLLPSARRQGYATLGVPPRPEGPAVTAVEAKNLTCRFGEFTAVDDVSFHIERGEIFGFVGSNGSGKTTTMKLLTGLLPATSGEALLFGAPLDGRDIATRRRVGYMSQGFSLYSELTVRQNLLLHARLFQVPTEQIAGRVNAMLDRFDLHAVVDVEPESLPLGLRQRLSLAVALVHAPEMLILDEPTSGVDPIARDRFWRELVTLSRRDNVTIFISTHFMNEAERCDRVALMHAGRVLRIGAPAALREARSAPTLDEAFVGYLSDMAPDDSGSASTVRPALAHRHDSRWLRALRRGWSYSWREATELRRDPIRLTLALVGSLLLMLIMAYGMSLDVEHLPFAVLDRDDSQSSRDYVLALSGSRYFRVEEPLRNYDDLERRMSSGALSVAIEIPSGFERDLLRGRGPEIGAWIDGAMPIRAETAVGYVQGMHLRYTSELRPDATAAITIEPRFRYNPDNLSIVGSVPSIIPVLLVFIPAMLTALAVVREKELGSIVNLYVTPVTKLEFLIGKQLPYIVLAMANFLVLVAVAVYAFGVPLRGSLPAFCLGALLYVTATTAFGLFMSAFTRSQIAAIFGTTLATIIPAVNFSGLITPVASLDGFAAFVGHCYPTAHFMQISQGIFLKSLGFMGVAPQCLILAATTPILLALCVALLRKQAK